MEDKGVLNRVSMNIKIIFLIILSIFLIFTVEVFAAGPWKGKVIDIETKEPLEGAVVLVFWSRNYRTPYGGSSYFYNVKETLTDKDGRFEIPAYTPINLLPIISYIKEPEFRIFKQGYGMLHMALDKYLTGKKEVEPYGGELLLSGYTIRVSSGLIELQKLKTREERRKAFPGLLMYDEANTKNYIRLLNIEAIEIGLDPYPEKGGKTK